MLVSSALRWMNGAASSVPLDKRKLLGFTDNRQDAALQAGHFNDFLFVSLLRAATLAAIRKQGAEGLAEEDFGPRVQQSLGFVAANQARRQEWMLDPEAKGPSLIDAERTLSRVIAHRVWADQRRGWRFTNPSLEDLGLVRAHYVGLDELAADDAVFENGPVTLRVATPDRRRAALLILLDTLRQGLAVIGRRDRKRFPVNGPRGSFGRQLGTDAVEHALHRRMSSQLEIGRGECSRTRVIWGVQSLASAL